jgi:hypothetical protein
MSATVRQRRESMTLAESMKTSPKYDWVLRRQKVTVYLQHHAGDAKKRRTAA